jgi:hypothetical protein
MSDNQCGKPLILKLLRCALALGLSSYDALTSPQTMHRKSVPPWKESLAPAAKGTHITLPKNLIQAIRANPDECNSLSPSDMVKVDAYLVRRRGQKLIVVGGRGSCFCSATGNCAFRVFRYQKGRYEKILDTDMVQQFGFVHSTTNSLPDLVTWSHGSAFDSGGALWQFNGESYQQICTWLLTSRRENEHGEWINVRPYITLNGCETNLNQR